jgi:hypothetical protein
MCGLAWSASDSSHLSNEYEPNTGNSHERDGGCRLHVTDIMSWLLPTEVDCYMSAITRSPEGLDARRLDKFPVPPQSHTTHVDLGFPRI